MAASSWADMPLTPAPPQPPVLARPMVILIHLQKKIDALDERIDALERDEDYHAREELCRKRAAMELAAFFRWRGSTPVEMTESIDAEFLYWFEGPYRLDLRKARRDLDQYLELGANRSARRQPAAGSLLEAYRRSTYRPRWPFCSRYV